MKVQDNKFEKEDCLDGIVYVLKNRQNIFRFEKIACVVLMWTFRLEREINDFRSFRG